MPRISANELRTKGLPAIESALSEASEVIVSVWGKDKFVVMGIEEYHYLRQCELAAVQAQTRADLAAGRVVKESPEVHLAQLDGAGVARGPNSLRTVDLGP